MARLEDNELYNRIQKDDMEAFELIYNRYERLLFSFSYRMVNQKVLAEEAVQNVFLKLWNNKGIYNEQSGKFSSWILTVTRNACIDIIRKESVTTEVHVAEYNINRIQAKSTEEIVNWKEEKRFLKYTISTLSKDQQDIIEMFYFKGYSQAQIAYQKKLPLGTVKGRIRLALKNLKKDYI